MQKIECTWKIERTWFSLFIWLIENIIISLKLYKEQREWKFVARVKLKKFSSFCMLQWTSDFHEFSNACPATHPRLNFPSFSKKREDLTKWMPDFSTKLFLSEKQLLHKADREEKQQRFRNNNVFERKLKKNYSWLPQVVTWKVGLLCIRDIFCLVHFLERQQLLWSL